MSDEEDEGSPEVPDVGQQPHPPRVWFLSGADSTIGIAVAKQVIENGETVIAGALSAKAGYSEGVEYGDEFAEFVDSVRATDDASKRRLLVIGLNTKLIADCHAAVAEAVKHFGRVDILMSCRSEALFGTVEELAQSDRTVSAVRDQFTTNFFGPMNMIKSLLPVLRSQRSGHILVLTGITAHIGTPGLSVYCASQWALEGFCDSLAYEIAPFNVKLTIVQPSIEVAILTNSIVAAPSMPEYTSDNNPAPLSRSLFASLLDRVDDATAGENDASRADSSGGGQKLVGADEVTRIAPRLPASMKEKLLAETLHAILQIGGHENPPARHIVGHEGVASVKEKLKTVSEELEEFVAVSEAVDYQTES